LEQHNKILLKIVAKSQISSEDSVENSYTSVLSELDKDQLFVLVRDELFRDIKTYVSNEIQRYLEEHASEQINEILKDPEYNPLQKKTAKINGDDSKYDSMIRSQIEESFNQYKSKETAKYNALESKLGEIEKELSRMKTKGANVYHTETHSHAHPRAENHLYSLSSSVMPAQSRWAPPSTYRSRDERSKVLREQNSMLNVRKSSHDDIGRSHSLNHGSPDDIDGHIPSRLQVSPSADVIYAHNQQHPQQTKKKRVSRHSPRSSSPVSSPREEKRKVKSEKKSTHKRVSKKSQVSPKEKKTRDKKKRFFHKKKKPNTT